MYLAISLAKGLVNRSSLRSFPKGGILPNLLGKLSCRFISPICIPLATAANSKANFLNAAASPRLFPATV